MVLDAVRGYVQLASGLTEVSRQRAVAEAKALLSQGGAFEQLVSDQAKVIADDLGRQVQTVADDIIATSKANRQVLVALIRAEAERAVGSLGLATADEIAELRRKVEQLDRAVNGGAARSTPKSPTAKKAAAKKAAPRGAATKTAAKKSPTAKSAATKPAPKKSAKKSAAKKSAATRTTTKRTTQKGTP